METKLKEKDPDLYFLIQSSSYEAREKARTILSDYKTTDDMLSDFVIEVRNKIVKDSVNPDLVNSTISNFQSLLMNTSDKITDISTISSNLSNSDNPLDTLILLDTLNQRLDKKEVDMEKINSTVKGMLLKDTSKDIIKKQILNESYKVYDWSVIPQFTKLVRLLAATKDKNLAYIIREVLYSPKVNKLNPDLVKQSIPLMASILNINYIDVLEDLVLTSIDNTRILYSLKEELENSKNRQVDNKLKIAKIYSELYASHTGRLVDYHLEVLRHNSDEILKLFIDTLDTSFVNKKDISNHSDLVSALILLNKTQLAMQLFEKSCYKPINKPKRAKEFSNLHRDSLLGSDFSRSLNLVIDACLKNSKYETLLGVLSHKKVDSLDANYIYDILVDTGGKMGESGTHQDCPIELRDRIIEVIKNKINDEKLLIYKTMNQWFERGESLLYDKDKALRYIDFIDAHLSLSMRKGEIEQEFIKEHRAKTKIYSSKK
jgi:hypothetical protein